jgi:hypothetical protein
MREGGGVKIFVFEEYYLLGFNAMLFLKTTAIRASNPTSFNSLVNIISRFIVNFFTCGTAIDALHT